MSKEIIVFGNIEFEKGKFNHRKNLILYILIAWNIGIYNNICNEVSNSIKKELDCKAIYNKNQNKILWWRGNRFKKHAIKIPEAGSYFIYWLVILIDSVLKKDGNYYLQLFFKKWK